MSRLRLVALVACILGGGCGRVEPPVEASAVASSEVDAGMPGAASPSPVRNATFDDLTIQHERGAPFDRSLLTPAIRKLDGKPIRICGYIFPTAQNRLKAFLLVRDNLECCFGRGPGLSDCIVVEMLEPATATYTTMPVTVEGRFTIQEAEFNHGIPSVIYHMDGRQVQ